MSPAKIAVLVVGFVLLVTALFYQQLTGSLRKVRTDEATALVERSAGLFLQQNRLQSLEFTSQTAQYARQEAFSRLAGIADPVARQKEAHRLVNALNEEQISKAYDRRAALVAIVDDAGKVVTRDLNPQADVGDDLKSRYPAVGMALAGSASKDIWAYKKRMYRVACAPIRGTDGKIFGALIVGFEESARDAKTQGGALGTQLAVFLDGQIYASSFATSGKESTEEQELAKSLFAGPQYAAPAVKSRLLTAPFQVQIPGNGSFVAVAAPLLGNSSQPEAGFVVLTSLDEAGAVANRVGLGVLLLGAIAALLTALAVLLTGRVFLAPLEQIEIGVTEILNGNRDYVFEKGSAVYEGLENSLNAMVARLLDRPEPGEGVPMPTSFDLGKARAEFSGPQPVPEAAPAAAVTLSPENQELAKEPAEQYLRRLFNEYVHAREQTGEGAKDLNYNSFVDKLKDNEADLCKKYGTRAVRFKVLIKQGQVTLKPVPIP